MSDSGVSPSLVALGVGYALSWLALPLASWLAARQGSAKWMCWAQRGALIGTAFLPLLVLGRRLLPQGAIPRLPVALHVEAWLTTSPGLSPGLPPRRFEFWWLFMIAGALWLVLLSLGIARELARAEQRRRLVASSDPAPPETAALSASLCAARGLANVSVRISPEPTCAGVVGVVWPTILLPCADLTLPPETLRLVLMHELEHVRRRDVWFRCVEALAESVLLGHPKLPALARAVALHREAAVDHVVGAENRLEYAELLLRVAERGGTAHPLTVSSGTALERRIEMLIEDKNRLKKPALAATFTLTAFILGTGLLLPSALAQKFHRRAPPPDQVEPKIEPDTDACYALAKKEDPKLVIDTVASLELDSEGSVTAAHIPSSSTIFQSCLEERAFAWHFPPPPPSAEAPKPPPDAKLFVRLRIERHPQ